MATDNRHRRGFPLTCKACSNCGPANTHRLVRGHTLDERAVALRCTECGHRWTSRHREAKERPLDLMPGGVGGV